MIFTLRYAKASLPSVVLLGAAGARGLVGGVQQAYVELRPAVLRARPVVCVEVLALEAVVGGAVGGAAVLWCVRYVSTCTCVCGGERAG